MVLPLTQLDAAREDMERFLQFRLSQLQAQTELKSLVMSLVNKLDSHQWKIQDLVLGNPLKNLEVVLRVLVGLGADQPLDTKFFPGIMEGLLGSLGINATGGKDPPTSSKEGAARMWATTIQNAIYWMERRDIPPEITPGMPSGLHVGYEEVFLHCRTTQVPRVFNDAKFLPGMANSVYDLPIPSTRGETMPSPVIAERFGYPEGPGDGPSDKPKPSQEEIDSSPIFDLRRAADDSCPPAVIGQYWIPHLEKEGYLASCPPKELPPKVL